MKSLWREIIGLKYHRFHSHWSAAHGFDPALPLSTFPPSKTHYFPQVSQTVLFSSRLSGKDKLQVLNWWSACSSNCHSCSKQRRNHSICFLLCAYFLIVFVRSHLPNTFFSYLTWYYLTVWKLILGCNFKSLKCQHHCTVSSWYAMQLNSKDII